MLRCIVRQPPKQSCWVRFVSSTIEIDVKLFVRICAILYGTCAMNGFAKISPCPFWLVKPYVLSCCNVLYHDFGKES